MPHFTLVNSAGAIIGRMSAPKVPQLPPSVRAIDGIAPSPQHTWNGTAWDAPAASSALAAARTAARAHVDRGRAAALTAPLTVAGITYGADASSLAHLALIASAVQADPTLTVNWPAADGTLQSLDAKAFAALVRAHAVRASVVHYVHAHYCEEIAAATEAGKLAQLRWVDPAMAPTSAPVTASVSADLARPVSTQTA